jgi:hypothetical protein
MNRKRGRTNLGFEICCLAFLALAGCATSTTVVPVRTVPVEPPADEAVFEPPPPVGPILAPGQVQELVPGGAIDWSGKTVWARGAGVLDPGNSNRDQAWQMAQRAATVVAQRNLLEIVKGVRVDSDTRVQDLIAEHDSAYQRIETVVKRARQRGPARLDSIGGTVEVELECGLYGADGVEGIFAPQPVAGPLTQNPSADGLSATAREFLRQYSALAFDGGNTGLKPALFPKLYDDSGALLFDTRELPFAGSTGTGAVQYIGRLDQIQARPDFGQPLVLRAREARGKLGTDIVLSRGDSDQLRRIEEALRLLTETGRVLVKLAL